MIFLRRDVYLYGQPKKLSSLWTFPLLKVFRNLNTWKKWLILTLVIQIWKIFIPRWQIKCSKSHDVTSFNFPSSQTSLIFLHRRSTFFKNSKVSMVSWVFFQETITNLPYGLFKGSKEILKGSGSDSSLFIRTTWCLSDK